MKAKGGEKIDKTYYCENGEKPVEGIGIDSKYQIVTTMLCYKHWPNDNMAMPTPTSDFTEPAKFRSD